MSLLHRPGRPLTIADFPPSQTPSEADLPSPAPEDALPYHRRFLPDSLTLPMDESRLPPIGIWPSALARKWTSPEWHSKLLPTRPGSLRLGFQPLHSTAGPFSVLSAILGSINYGQDTVLTLWKRAEAYLQFAWNRADCYPAHRLGLHTIHNNLDAYKDSRSLSLISGLRLPYTPSLLEVFQRCSSPRLLPVIYYILAGAYSGPLRVILTFRVLRRPGIKSQTPALSSNAWCGIHPSPSWTRTPMCTVLHRHCRDRSRTQIRTRSP